MNKTSWLLFFWSRVCDCTLGSWQSTSALRSFREVTCDWTGPGKWKVIRQTHSVPREKNRQLKFDIEEPFWFLFCLSFSCFLHVSVSAWMTKCDAFLKSAESRQKTADARQFCKCKKTRDETGWAVTKKQCVKLNGLPSSVSMDVTVFWWCYLRGSNAARYLCGPNQKKSRSKLCHASLNEWPTEWMNEWIKKRNVQKKYCKYVSMYTHNIH